MSIFQSNIQDLLDILRTAGQEGEADAQRCADLTCQVLGRGGRVFLCGNGGSAATASHLANDMLCHMKNWSRRGYPMYCLNDSAAAITSLSNDYGPDQIFAKQLSALAAEGDLLWAFSTSGNSPNVVRAVELAKTMGVATVGFTGAKGGALKDLCDLCIRVPSNEVMRVEEMHIVYAHCIGETVEATLSPAECQP